MSSASKQADGSVVVSCDVWEVQYSVHEKKGAPPDAPRSMRVDYRTDGDQWYSEWICFEHVGFPREKAANWWSLRSRAPTPNTAQEAVNLALAGALAHTKRIYVRLRPGEEYPRVVGAELGAIPEYGGQAAVEMPQPPTGDEIPF